MDRTNALQAFRNNPARMQEAQEQFQTVLTRSATDMEFRSLLLSDSRAALSQHFGREVPASINIVFVENKADATVVLPDVISESELSETELETVAGGTIQILVAEIALGMALHSRECENH